ncbi:MAG: Crp/Fnr family transcriptional regulator [Cyclobacteriaceae bacterium]
MNDQLEKNLSRFISLSKSEGESFFQACTYRKLKRKEFLLKEGEVCKFTSFILKGCLRYFYNVEGDEHTGQFFFENSWYTDYESFLSGNPSQQNIDALEPTELLLIQKQDLEKLYDLNPKIERFGRLMAENAYMGVRKKNENLLNLSPEERYLKLIKERPKVIERVSQHYIASFLGIQPQSLSRIRKRISENR